MALAADVVRASGKVTLVANTSKAVRLSSKAQYIEIVNGISTILYYTIDMGGSDVTDVDVTADETFGVPPLGKVLHPVGGNADVVVNVEASVAGDVVIQARDY